jgi:predicted SAM-dependent methyltransferase
MKLLNIGCGENYHNDWINLDIVPLTSHILKYDILKKIPFPDDSVDILYHSHLLEHLQKNDGNKFINECYRVLKPEGIMRIAVPDLEEIINNYRIYLEKSTMGDKLAEANYDFTMLELFDQIVRNFNGGELGNFYKKGYAINSDFVYNRTGVKLKQINDINNINSQNFKFISKKQSIINSFKSFYGNTKKIRIKTLLLKIILQNEYKYYDIGKFKLSGELHQWMYDKFSLNRMLINSGFKNVKVCSASESRINNWDSYHLDITKEGLIRKPDSLFMEANK